MIVSKVKGKVFLITSEGTLRSLKVGDRVKLGRDKVLLSKDTSISYHADFSDNYYKAINYLFYVQTSIFS